jgi:predicted porin
MNKLFLTMALAFSTMIASAQYSVLTTFIEDADSSWNATDKIGVGYSLNDCTMIGITMDGEDKYELLARYVIHKSGVWVTGVYNYDADNEDELVDKMELGLGYSFNVWDKLYIDPNYTMSMKKDEAGEREGTLNISISYKL